MIAALTDQIEAQIRRDGAAHESDLEHTTRQLARRGIDVEAAITHLTNLRIAVPSWALGTGGTRFGRFSEAGEPHDLEQKVADVASIDRLTRTSGEISLHIPWDQPDDPIALRDCLAAHGIACGPINSNTFQDGERPNDPRASYRHGSVSNVWGEARARAVGHMVGVVELGRSLGSKALTVWLSDGTNHPGQHSFRGALDRTIDSLAQVYAALPADWSLYTEHKPFEPAFYSSVNPDWGASLLIARALGPQARCLVDLGHHLPNANIEQIVAMLAHQGRLGGFHFNDSKYGDDDLTAGSIQPFQLFLICHELVEAERDGLLAAHVPDLMIDASHNVKDPMEDILQSIEAILIAYAQALSVDPLALAAARAGNDPALAQDALQDAFRSDVRPLVREARRRKGGALHPLAAFRAAGYRQETARRRGFRKATGL